MLISIFLWLAFYQIIDVFCDIAAFFIFCQVQIPRSDCKTIFNELDQTIIIVRVMWM